MFAAIGGVCPKTKLWNDMQERDCRTFEEFCTRAESTCVLRMLRRPFGKLTPSPKTPKTRKTRRENTRSLSRMTKNDSNLRIELQQLYYPGVPTIPI